MHYVRETHFFHYIHHYNTITNITEVPKDVNLIEQLSQFCVMNPMASGDGKYRLENNPS